MNENPRWLDNNVQFPRLIVELKANVTISREDWSSLCDSMDLSGDYVDELFDRAEAEWGRIKKETA